MTYTIKELAKLSNVSVRTLHWYDRINLLKPSSKGSNQYRYYEEPQLLRLQQILFFKELGFSLNDIQNLLSQDDFDHIKALNAHRILLEKEIVGKNNLLLTIDKTIQHLKGKLIMKDQELYYGFDSKKQKQYEQQLVNEGVVTQEWMEGYKNKMSTWSEKDKENFILEASSINKDLIACMTSGFNTDSKEVQAIMKRHHAWVGWNPTKEGYIGLSETYQTPEFKAFYDKLHPNLLPFIVDAMIIYANNNL